MAERSMNMSMSQQPHLWVWLAVSQICNMMETLKLTIANKPASTSVATFILTLKFHLCSLTGTCINALFLISSPYLASSIIQRKTHETAQKVPCPLNINPRRERYHIGSTIGRQDRIPKYRILTGDHWTLIQARDSTRTTSVHFRISRGTNTLRK